MLQTRLWMGAILIILTVGMLVADQYLAYFPFLFVFQLGLGLLACHELIGMLGPNRKPHAEVCYLGIVGFTLANWLVNHANPFANLAGILAGFLLFVFLYEMATFAEDGRSVERMANTWFILAYLGFLPCFLAQIRWISPDHQANSVRLALAVFVPKSCDIGAYCVG